MLTGEWNMRRIRYDYRSMFYFGKEDVRHTCILLSSLEAMEFVGKKWLNTNDGGAYKKIWSCTNRQPPETSAEVKNGWSYACASPRDFLACYRKGFQYNWVNKCYVIKTFQKKSRPNLSARLQSATCVRFVSTDKKAGVFINDLWLVFNLYSSVKYLRECHYVILSDPSQLLFLSASKIIW